MQPVAVFSFSFRGIFARSCLRLAHEGVKSLHSFTLQKRIKTFTNSPHDFSPSGELVSRFFHSFGPKTACRFAKTAVLHWKSSEIETYTPKLISKTAGFDVKECCFLCSKLPF